MKKILLYSLILFITFSCKSDKKEKSDAGDSGVKTEVSEKTVATFKDSLLDFRDVNKEFTSGYMIKSFGMKKIKNNLYAFVFNLDDNITDETVNSYSLGIRSFDTSEDEPFMATFSPKIEIKDDEKYLILQKRLGQIRYFDSLSVYIYERDNWKKSGRLGGFKIRDILFEEKE